MFIHTNNNISDRKTFKIFTYSLIKNLLRLIGLIVYTRVYRLLGVQNMEEIEH